MTLDGFLGGWCVALSLAFIWPQVWRAIRHDTSHGLSPFALLHGLVGSSLWLSYGILQHDIAVWGSNCSFIVAQSLIISVTYRHGRIPRRTLIQVALAVAAVLVGFTQLPAGLVGIVAICVSGSSVLPQFAHVVRTDNLHAISLASYALTIVSTFSWLVYGFVVGDPMVSVQNFFVGPMFIFMFVKAWSWRTANNVPVFG